MPLFIRPPDRKDYGTLAVDAGGGLVWNFRGPFDAQDTRDAYSRPVTDADFTNGSAFFKADSAADLDWCDHILDHNLETAFIAPDGRFFSFIAHEVFIEQLLKPALAEENSEAAIRGWVRISHQLIGFQRYNPRLPDSQKTGAVTHHWHHASDRDVMARPLSRSQSRILEKIGYSAADKEQGTNLRYEDVFGSDDTPGMNSLRKQVALALKDRHRIVEPDEARLIIQDFKRRHGIHPSPPGMG